MYILLYDINVINFIVLDKFIIKEYYLFFLSISDRHSWIKQPLNPAGLKIIFLKSFKIHVNL